jgi:Flp pilus assembly protein TadB
MIPIAGALAAALAVTCALLVPLADRPIPRVDHPDARALADAGWRRSLWQWEGIRAAFTLVLVLVLTPALGQPVLAAAVGLIGPSILIRLRADAAARRARIATTRLLRGTEAVLRSGGGLAEALRRGVDASEDPVARKPFAEALRAFDLGAPLDEALRSAASGTRDRRARMALETLAIGVTLRLPGDRAGVLVAAVTDRLAFEERLDEEVRARTSGLRSQVMLLAAVVPGIAAYLAATVPSLGATLSAPIGRTILVPAAIALELIGIVVSRRAVDGVVR